MQVHGLKLFSDGWCLIRPNYLFDIWNRRGLGAWDLLKHNLD